MALRTRAQSSTERVMGPILSMDQTSAMAPVRGTRPKAGAEAGDAAAGAGRGDAAEGFGADSEADASGGGGGGAACGAAA